MTQKHSELRVLVVGQAHVQAEFQWRLADQHPAFFFVSRMADLSQIVSNQEWIHVVVLPTILQKVDW